MFTHKKYDLAVCKSESMINSAARNKDCTFLTRAKPNPTPSNAMARTYKMDSDNVETTVHFLLEAMERYDSWESLDNEKSDKDH